MITQSRRTLHLATFDGLGIVETGGGGSAIGGDEDGGMDKRNKHL